MILSVNTEFSYRHDSAEQRFASFSGSVVYVLLNLQTTISPALQYAVKAVLGAVEQVRLYG